MGGESKQQAMREFGRQRRAAAATVEGGADGGVDEVVEGLGEGGLGEGGEAPTVLVEESPHVEEQTPQEGEQTPQLVEETPQLEEQTPRVEEQTPRVEEQTAGLFAEYPPPLPESPRGVFVAETQPGGGGGESLPTGGSLTIRLVLSWSRRLN